jgi:hypothetical protein
MLAKFNEPLIISMCRLVTLPTGILQVLTAILVVFLMTKCNSCKNNQQRSIKQLAEAQRETNEISQLLGSPNNVEQDIKEEKIIKDWYGSYATYFERKEKEVPTEYIQFLRNGYEISVGTVEIIIKYDTYIRESNKWYPILEFRNTTIKVIEAIASIKSGLQGELEAVKLDINSIKGGCSSGTCPYVSASYVKAESKKLQKILQGIEKMLETIKVQDEQVYIIGKEAVKVATQALVIFEHKTNNFDRSKMESERKKLFYSFVQSSALFTIALKELLETSLAR